MPAISPMITPEAIGRALMKARIWFIGPLP